VRAIAALVAGRTVKDAADAAGVARETVHRWRRDDLQFIAALNRERRDARDAVSAEVRALGRDAVAVLRKLLRSRSTPPALRARIAWDLLTGLGATGPEPFGETDPDRLRESRVQDERAWARWSGLLENSLPRSLTRPDWTPLADPASEPALPDPLADLLGRVRSGPPPDGPAARRG
jgi:hypothetical protein